MKKLLCAGLLSVMLVQANAALIPLDLIGTAGVGLLPGNETPGVTGGTGGEINTGITYDDVTNLLDLTNVGWGSSQGFADLGSLATLSHIHGPTATVNGNGFTENTGVAFTLTRSSDAVTGGTFTNPLVDFDTVFGGNAETREAQLLNGQFYINIHTANNGSGEMRGFIVPVPEPSTAALLVTGALGMLARRRRRSHSTGQSSFEVAA